MPTDDKNAILLKMIQSMDESHGGYQGKSLQEKIRDDLDSICSDAEVSEYTVGLRDGIAHALGVLRGTSMQVELDEAQERWKAKQ